MFQGLRNGEAMLPSVGPDVGGAGMLTHHELQLHGQAMLPMLTV